MTFCLTLIFYFRLPKSNFLHFSGVMANLNSCLCDMFCLSIMMLLLVKAINIYMILSFYIFCFSILTTTVSCYSQHFDFVFIDYWIYFFVIFFSLDIFIKFTCSQRLFYINLHKFFVIRSAFFDVS